LRKALGSGAALGLVAVREHHGGTLEREGLRAGEADPLRRAGDERGLPLELHGYFFSGAAGAAVEGGGTPGCGVVTGGSAAGVGGGGALGGFTAAMMSLQNASRPFGQAPLARD